MKPLDLLILALATFYAAYAISATHGPWHVFGWLRDHLPLGGLAACLVCLSPWLAALFYVLLLTPLAVIVYVPAAITISSPETAAAMAVKKLA